MKRSDLIIDLAEEKNLSINDSDRIIRIILKEISDSLLLRQRAEFRGFGSFSVKVRDKRLGRNPRTGEVVNIDRKYLPHFKMAKDFYEKIKGDIAKW